MPDPAWTMQYLFNQPPEGNGFTRSMDYQVPAIVNTITGGNPANRRVEIDASDPLSGAVYKTSQIPALDSSVGVTAEMMVNVSGGAGNAGIELTFLDYQVLLCIFLNKLNIYSPRSGGQNELNIDVATSPNNSDILWRVIFFPDHSIQIWRAGVLVFGPVPVSSNLMPFQRVLWWAESGILAIFKAFRYYSGGAVIPG